MTDKPFIRPQGDNTPPRKQEPEKTAHRKIAAVAAEGVSRIKVHGYGTDRSTGVHIMYLG